MERHAVKFRWMAMGLAGLIALLLFAARLASDGMEDTGDAVQHYMIARHVWSHPRLFLEQWGKPLFAFLGYPFSLLGYPGMSLFNGLLGVCGTAMATVLLRRSGILSMLLFPVLVLLGPLMTHLIMNGMTEILFGTLTLATVVLLDKKCYWQAALVASLTPLSRPEYIVFLPFVGLWLCLMRRWSAVPCLAAGIGLYTAGGWLATGDPLCWIHNDPHAHSDGVYGSGDAIQYILHAPPAFGWGLVLVFLCALWLWPLTHARDTNERRTHQLLAVVGALPVLSIIGVHTYLWATGTHGSAGLARVLCTASPLAAVFGLFTLGRLALTRRSVAMWPMVAGALVVAGAQATGIEPLVQHPAPDQRALQAACDVVGEHWRPGMRVFSTHPYAAFHLGLDGFDPTTYRMLWGFNGMDDNVPSRTGDLVVWDSQLGPNECGVPLQRFLDDTAFTVLGVFEPSFGHIVIGDHPMEFWAFQRSPASRIHDTDTLFSGIYPVGEFNVRQDTSACEIPEAWRGERDFPWSTGDLACPGEGSVYDEVACTFKLSFPTEHRGEVRLVFKQMRGEEMVRYDERPLSEGDNAVLFRIPPCEEGVDQSLYFWVPESTPIQVRSMVVTRSRIVQMSAR